MSTKNPFVRLLSWLWTGVDGVRKVLHLILLLTVFLCDELNDLTGWSIWGILTAVLFTGLFFYLYKAMRNFYGQRRGKTLLKFFLVSLLSLVMMLVLFLLFAFFSAFTF